MGDTAKRDEHTARLDPSLLRKRFAQQEEEVLLVNARRSALLGIIFVMGGLVLDRVVYPDLFSRFLLLRVACCLVLGGVLGLLCWPPMRPFTRVLCHILALLPMLTLDWMLVEIELAETRHAGGTGPYYAGLNLTLVGAVLILRWRFIDGVFNSVLCLGGYLAVAFAMRFSAEAISTSTFFIFVTAFFACLGLYFYNRLRFAEFCLREEVVAQQEVLAENHRRLKDLDEAKTRFFANISHELRTPLTLILAPIEKMHKLSAVRQDPQLRAMIDSLEDNGMRLLRLINDLLDLVRLDSGEMPARPERFRPALFIEGLGRNLLPMAERKRIHLTWQAECAEDLEVYQERDRLEKIVLNLAVNALKFTPPGGRVNLKAGVGKGHFHLEVADNGAGMREDQISSAFERFWQADTSIRKKHRGVGIGLALVKSLTESMDGTVEIDSKFGKGTTFRIDVPLLEMPAEEPETATGAGAKEPDDVIELLHEQARLHGAVGPLETLPSILGTPGMIGPALDVTSRREQVLVAEDEDGLRRFLRAELEELGCEVIEASDGAEAWQFARQFQPELILADYMMPEKDGITLTRELRADDLTSQIPIVLLTAAADEPTRLQALEAGVSDFLTKPFTTAELRLRIRNLLDRQSYQRELGIKHRALAAALEEIKENEARLLQAEKLSSLGRMSAGIVHEVNNPLNYAKTALHTLRVYGDDIAEEERDDYIETIADAEEGVDRVIRIVSDLRSFTKGEVAMKEEVRLAETIEMARRLLSSELQGIDFKVDIADDIVVGGNGNQLCQVFVNIIQNSAQALKGARERGVEPVAEVRAETTASGRVRICLRDNGPGIAPEDIDHVFDPFFTKREVGEGMGLGLSICHRILESHQGRIEVDSVLGEYTEFKITLPRPWDEPEEEHEDDMTDHEIAQLEGAQAR